MTSPEDSPTHSKIGRRNHPSHQQGNANAPVSPIPPQPIVFLDDSSELDPFFESIRRSTLLAVDTETNGLFAYRSEVCLIQISDAETIWIIDALAFKKKNAVDALVPLFHLFESPRVTKILHGASHDIASLKADFGIVLSGIFDTQAAATFLGRVHTSLAALLLEEFGIALPKTLQKSNWARRPLHAEDLSYLANDVAYLHKLQRRLEKDLRRADLVEESSLEFARICETPPAEPAFSPDDFWKIRGVRQRLSDRQLARLRRFFLLRDSLARHWNRPPFKVLSNSLLISLAEASSLKSLRRHPLFRKPRWKKQFPRFENAFRAAAEDPPPIPPESTRNTLPERRPLPLPYHHRPFEKRKQFEKVLKNWRTAEAKRKGIATSAVLPAGVLEILLLTRPSSRRDLSRIPGFGEGRNRKYGKAILDIVARF